MTMAHNALIIDDEADIRELIAMSLDRIGLDTHTAANLEEAEHLLANYAFDVCLTDMRLPDGNGVEFVKKIHAMQPQLPVAVITAHGNMEAAVEAMKNGAFDFVSKPVDLTLLRNLVMQAIESRDTASNEDTINTDTNAESRPSTLADLSGRHSTSEKPLNLVGGDRLIGKSKPMQSLRQLISKVAKTNAPIWITGESGTGKELIARLIHDNSPRAQSPFVAINCGAIPSELMESEMFGHRKGSFTGALSDHNGLFMQAYGGTLFLDEVAELPIHMQVKLLRAIQERSIRPVGSSDELSTDVRILSASHKDLAEEVKEGRFRNDLYYRLNVISIMSPALRDRASDVNAIAEFILQSHARQYGHTDVKLLTDEAEQALSSYTFPGNVRELENILERSIALSEGDAITAGDLNLQSVVAADTTQATRNRSVEIDSELDRIRNALNSARWNRRVAAEQLGMTYRQLRYKINQLGIDQGD